LLLLLLLLLLLEQVFAALGRYGSGRWNSLSSS
jgi:hypothetical protein